ncbi:MAG: hypothetical protein E7360_00540 [Clostridiales bacterium]|nr:hypothetical protein [Clostridiales bacterium]
MFGYVKPEMPYLYLKDDTLYKALYCGVCKSIGRNCSQRARLSLTYDIAFFSALVHNIAGEDVKIVRQRCVTHWIKKRPMVGKGDALTDLSAAINVELAYYKIRDDILDGNGGKIKLAFFKKSHKKVLKSRPEISAIIEKNYGDLFKLEREKCSSIDMICDPFAKMMEELGVYVLKEKATDEVKKLFYYLGKWIYLIDALDDYEKDVKEGNYNPLYYAYGEKPTVKEFYEGHGKEISFAFSEIFASLKVALSGCKFYFNHDLIDNIILRGIPSVTLKILKKEIKDNG